MITIRNEGIILEKTNLDFENQAVLNPGCIEVDGIVHMFYRAVHEGNLSTVGYCQLKDNKVIYRSDKPILFPEQEYEKHGIEDPRILLHEDGTYYLFYTAYDGLNARVAYATSSDLKEFSKQGLITPAITFEHIREYYNDLPLKQKYILYGLKAQNTNKGGSFLWEKDAFLFPKKINGRYALVHRIMPSIQVIFCDDLHDLQSNQFWTTYFKDIAQNTILDPRTDDNYVGGGCPPIETEDGWLLIYHRVKNINGKANYCAGAALLDRNDPHHVLGKLQEPFFIPTEPWEKIGDVNNVVFPTGAIEKEGRIYIYYGAADKVIGCKSVDKNELLTELKNSPLQKAK